MKKLMNDFWKIFKFPLLYLCISMSLGAALIGIFSIKEEVLVDYAYWLIAISGILSISTYRLTSNRSKEKLLESCKFKKISLSTASIALTISIGLSAAVCSFIALMQNDFELYLQTSSGVASNIRTLTHFIPILILIPIVEEIIFRGLSFNELKNKTNPIFSVILQALVYMFFRQNLVQDANTFFLFALVLGLVYLWTDSILTSIIINIGYYIMSTLVFPFLIYKTSKFVFVYLILGLAIAAVPMMFLYGKYRLFKQGRIESL